MMSETMKWLLLSMLISLSSGRFCHNSGNCSCQRVSYMNWEIRCSSDSNPRFIARLKIDAATVQVECNDATSWSEFGYQSTYSLIRSSITLSIERCPLPGESFDYITKRFGLMSANYLTYTSHMNLTSTLTQRHLSMLSALNSLNLSSNGLTDLPSDLFRDLDILEQLDLSFNDIMILPRDIFRGLSVLWKIDLTHNAIKFVDWRLFSYCTNLNQLSLRGNLITSLDYRTFRGINQLHVINLAENLLDTLPPGAFQHVKQLMIDISGNRFSTLPEELFSRTGLTKLTLGHNRGILTTLPMNFLNNLTTLEEVILSRNNLTSLPENIFWGSFSVQSIDLHRNALSTLPKNIFRDSRSLISLDLSDNKLNYVPEGLFRELSKLRRLNLARNDIASLSENIFGHLSSLLELNLGFNKITSIHRITFRKLPNIRVIRLSHNYVDLTEFFIMRLNKYFYGATIQKIFLDHNNLTGWFFVEKVDYDIPANLQLVDLTYNQISDVRVTSPLIGSHDVEYDFRHNNVRSVDILDEISSKVTIVVDDNTFYCGCSIYVSLKYMRTIREPQYGEDVEIVLGNASCSQPHWMIGTSVRSLRLETFACRPDDDYRHVRCPDGCDCWWRPHDRTRIVDCSSRNVGKMPEEIIEFVDEDGSEDDTVLDMYVDDQTSWFDWRNSRVELDLANNSLTQIPTLNGSGYEHVEILILSYNNVSRLSFDVLPPRLKVLRVDHNDLRTLNGTTVEAVMKSTSLQEVNFERNPWDCASETRNYLALLEEKFGKNVRYSFVMQICLDPRQATSFGWTDRLYISFARF